MLFSPQRPDHKTLSTAIDRAVSLHSLPRCLGYTGEHELQKQVKRKIATFAKIFSRQKYQGTGSKYIYIIYIFIYYIYVKNR